MKKYLFVGLTIFTFFFAPYNLIAQITERPRPEEWKQLVKGARFIDRILPMPKGKLSSDTWGAKNVLPRYVDNGIEDRTRSYWGGKILLGDDKLYHLYVCGWLESSPKGHAEWPNSIVYHTVSNNSIGPFVIKDTIGHGHNPEGFRLKDGRYVIYIIDSYYISNGLNGPWELKKFDFENRDRPIIEGLSNLTFAQREDGSYLMVCRGGGAWISKTGISSYNQITDRRVYPNVKGEFEDPVIWRDQVQYHLIVNDWLGRIAFYQRSKDGLNWVTDPGEAYTPGVAVHEDGRVEDWYKFERIKIFQDKFGRAIQANFAVIDTSKADDKANDRHSSKNIGVPLNPGVLLTMLNKELPTAKNKVIRVKITAENGFNPQTDIDIKSLRFGASSEVNFGKGSKVLSVEKSNKDLIVNFDAKGNGITKDEFAPKLIGKYSSGKLLYGYTRVPWLNYNEAILSARKPIFSANANNKTALKIPVENFGQVASKQSSLTVTCLIGNEQKSLGSVVVPVLQPYGKTDVNVLTDYNFEKGKEYAFSVTVSTNNTKVSLFEFKVIPFK
ncbi:glycoside hydrolase family protein [Pedobacter sp. B4-66]|uniref:glycoside hydrolase family protein n=1 Tax=Pedobacter sp. B4-66 TaxID=2817280 RepID=UPI0020245FEA|nr:glycoside hydrolase family protein [Pedobacter sp. B4-66]